MKHAPDLLHGCLSLFGKSFRTFCKNETIVGNEEFISRRQGLLKDSAFPQQCPIITAKVLKPADLVLDDKLGMACRHILTSQNNIAVSGATYSQTTARDGNVFAVVLPSIYDYNSHRTPID